MHRFTNISVYLLVVRARKNYILGKYIYRWPYCKDLICINIKKRNIVSFPLSAHSSTTQTTSSQIIFLTSHLTAGVLLASYSASLISSLTVRRPTLPFETFQEMLEDGSYHLDVLSNSGEMDYFRVRNHLSLGQDA